MSDFSDRPFVAGSLVGLRAFAVDHTGRLYGPTFDQVFRPGENEAECRRSELSTAIFTGGWSTFTIQPAPLWRPSLSFVEEEAGKEVAEPSLAEAAVEAKKPEKPKHSLAGVKCSCGFYAYFDGGNDYKESHRVAVLIEGYGVCTVGSRGFRAQKARPVALIAPGRKFPEGRFQLVLRNYPDVPVYASKSAALEAHPLTVPDVPGPDAPGFWDRPVKS